MALCVHINVVVPHLLYGTSNDSTLDSIGMIEAALDVQSQNVGADDAERISNRNRAECELSNRFGHVSVDP